MNTQDEIQQVEVSLEEAQKIVAFGEALGRLENNRDFRAVILDGYFKDEAARLVMLTGAPHIHGEGREDVLAAIRGVAEFRQFLLARRTAAQMATKEIGDYQESLDELRAEEG